MTAPVSGLASVDLPALVAQARRAVEPPPDAATLLEGSLAETFGNETSDIDLVFLSDDPDRHATMPTVVFLQGRRVEIRIRSLDQGFRQLANVTDAAARGRRALSRVSRDLIDRVQRVGHALPLEGTERSAQLQAACAAPEVVRIVRDWYLGSADDALLTADTLRVLGDEVAARSWCRTAGIHTVKAWLAERGDTYIEPKWYEEQLLRTEGGPAVLAELNELHAAHAGSDNLQALVASVAAFRARHMEGASVPLGGRAVLGRNRRVTTWRIGRGMHILGPDRSVYVLGDTAARIWSQLPFGAGVADATRRFAEAGEIDAGRVIAELHRLGLVVITVQGRGILSTRAASGTRPIVSAMQIGVDGAVRPPDLDPTGIHPLPIRAAAFVEAGMGLVWGNVVVENAIEDIEGALKKQQWGLLAVATRRCVRFLCITALSACGVAPAPADEEAVAVAGQLGVLPESLWASAKAIEDQARASDVEEATASADDLGELVAAVRAHLPGGALPSSFTGASGWSDTLAVGGDWMRLAVYLGVRPPKEEAQDLIDANRS